MTALYNVQVLALLTVLALNLRFNSYWEIKHPTFPFAFLIKYIVTSSTEVDACLYSDVHLRMVENKVCIAEFNSKQSNWEWP